MTYDVKPLKGHSTDTVYCRKLCWLEVKYDVYIGLSTLHKHKYVEYTHEPSWHTAWEATRQ